jgi:hypothetical protein
MIISSKIINMIGLNLYYSLYDNQEIVMMSDVGRIEVVGVRRRRYYVVVDIKTRKKKMVGGWWKTKG